MSNIITCPHCKKTFEMSEALKHTLTEIKEEEISKIQKAAEAKATEKVREEIEFKLKDSKNENEELRQQNKDLREQLLELNKTLRELKDKFEKTEVENAKKLNEELEVAKYKIAKAEQEKSQLEKNELKKKLADTEKALDEARRKASQSSQQLQGEVLELELEENLRNEFPEDEIRPIKKGSEGGDILQIVKARNGMKVGSILWETKRTKVWSDSWLPKLREDQRNAGASIAVINSITLPKNVETFKFIDNVWVTAGNCSIPLAHALRTRLLEVASYKLLSKDKGQTKELIFNYLTSETSRHRVEAQVEGIIELQNDLLQEQRALVKSWKKRELQHKKMINNLSAFYGELQAIMGTALPTVKTLELPDPDQAEENNKK